ncbi:hypothetical protein CgunFtcFv8_006463 [Champsocephalus gunnari]|uniref:Uncharacterized protein n=1 Tax=Champsocephalus gunnari TaxID=52237 RepID=A0AAN8GZB9_CHAGU|nr:hypothetical protein CgunFtcFv8_006463 [Champsocephalus gunnari]
MASTSDTTSDTCECLGTTATANTCECFHNNGKHSAFTKTLATTTQSPTSKEPSNSTTANALFQHQSTFFISHQPNGECLKPSSPGFIL